MLHLFVALLLVGGLQQAPIITSSDAVGFDYVTANLTTYQVNDFQVQYDGGGSWLSLGVAGGRTLADTPSGSLTYSVIPPFASGTHSISIRACGTGGCSVGTSPFAFAYAASTPVTPSGVRKVPRL